MIYIIIYNNIYLYYIVYCYNLIIITWLKEKAKAKEKENEKENDNNYTRYAVEYTWLFIVRYYTTR